MKVHKKLSLKFIPAILATTAIIGSSSMWAAQAQTSFQIAQAGGAAADLMAKFGTPDKAVMAKGKKLYDANCASCHMVNGQGMAALKSRNFTKADGWKQGRTIDALFETLRNGLKGTAMAGFKHLAVADRFAIIHHVRTFGDFPEIKGEELVKVHKKYDLLSSKFKAITVTKAIQLLDAENANMVKMIAQMAEKAAKASGEGAELFKDLAYDKAMALTTLSRSSVWKDSLEDFVMVVMSSADNNGFSSRAANLQQADWKALHSFLSEL